jgi:UDP-N-acetylglucosamine acyltransferase
MRQSLSYIDPEATLADDVVVEPFSVIYKNVSIGEGSWIGSNVTIYEGTIIGKNCRVFPGAVLGAVPQDLKFDGEQTTVTIGDNTTIRECVTINRGTKDKFTTAIGNNCLLMAYTHIAHDCMVGHNVIIANGVQMAGHVIVEDNARIGGLSAIHQFVKVGRHVMIEGGSMVSKDVPPFIKAGRYPLAYEGLNSVGLRRNGFTNEKINEIQDIYRILFVHNRNLTKAMHIVESESIVTAERDEILSFIKDSERGVIKGYSGK